MRLQFRERKKVLISVSNNVIITEEASGKKSHPWPEIKEAAPDGTSGAGRHSGSSAQQDLNLNF